VAEKAMGTRNAEQHAVKLTQQLLPFDERDMLLMGWHGVEDFQQESCGVWWVRNGLLHGVDKPAEDDFTCGPTPITF
jgi:hypothetical protein